MKPHFPIHIMIKEFNSQMAFASAVPADLNTSGVNMMNQSSETTTGAVFTQKNSNSRDVQSAVPAEQIAGAEATGNATNVNSAAGAAAQPAENKQSAFRKFWTWLNEDDTEDDGLTPEEREAKKRANRAGFAVLYRKELADHLSSKRFWAMFVLLFLVSVAALYGAVGALQQASLQAQAKSTSLGDFMFLKLFTTSGSNIYSFSTFLGFLGPVFGIMLGFDAINNEIAQGTLNRLAAQPIYRDTIINAKFLAGATIVFMTVFSLGGLLAGMGLLMSGINPAAEEWFRLIIFLFMAGVYISLWLAIAVLFSTTSRHAATSALISIALWLFLTMFFSFVATGLANLVYPSAGASAQSLIGNYRLNAGLNRISPFYLFSEVTSVLMNPNVRSLDIMSLVEYQNGAIASYLTLGQSLLQIWPHLVAMIAEALIGFAAAYISFMRKEIRA